MAKCHNVKKMKTVIDELYCNRFQIDLQRQITVFVILNINFQSDELQDFENKDNFSLFLTLFCILTNLLAFAIKMKEKSKI